MSQRWLVTGGSGFIGSAIVRRLVHDGNAVRVLDDLSRGRSHRLEDLRTDIELIEGDVRNGDTVATSCSGVDAVCHLASINGTELFYRVPERVLDVGVRGMLNVIDGTIRHGVRRLFVASSSEVYQTPPRIPTDETVPLSIPDPRNPRYSYAGAKLISELLTINFGRQRYERAVVFRPHNVYGPDMGWEHVVPQLSLRVRELARQQPRGRIRLPIQGTGNETRAFAYIDDVVDGLRRVFDGGEHLGIYNIGTDEETSVETLAREIARCFGREVDVVPGPAAVGSTMRRCPDITKLRALGYAPLVPLREGLEKTVRWYDAHADERPAA